ncbi:MAG: preprotein translocase subunit SecE [Planctomycetota bacterium]|jgi:preprotein translocase SecE subunit|nr:preprotein translocase subunit SecE [Planctomycetota bacterium]
MAYRKDQGRMARMTAFWSLAILIFYGCVSLQAELATSFAESLGQSINGMRIPVLGLDLSPALLITAAVLALALGLLYRWEQTPKNADLLIETESELRKVSWPTLDEAINGSWAVMMTVLVLMGFLAGVDFLLGRVARVILTGGA